MPTYDPTQADGGDGFEPIPAGLYKARIERASEAYSAAKDPMIKITFKISEGEFYKRLIFDNLTFNKKGMGRVKIMLKALGLSTDQGCEVTPELLLGRDILIDVIQDQYEGKTNNRVPYAGYHRDESETPSF